MEGNSNTQGKSDCGASEKFKKHMLDDMVLDST